MKDLTEAALEEIERQEAKLDSMETEEDLGEAVVHELGAAEGRIFIVKEEDAVLDEEQELELQDVQVQQIHQENMPVTCIPHQTPLLYRKTGVCRGKPIFLIFALKHRLWVLVRTASPRRF